MDKSSAGAGFLREFRFPLPIYNPSASPQSSSLSPEAGTIGQEWPQCQEPHKPELKKISIIRYMNKRIYLGFVINITEFCCISIYSLLFSIRLQ
jgi:hypothetical protein